MEVRLRAETPSETAAVGEALAPLFLARDVVVLTGELGAGKTTFVQGVAAGLGVEDPVVSPTFTLIKEYAGRLDVAHVDVYRLERVQDVVDLGLDELGSGESRSCVEWGDAVEDLLPAERLRVELIGRRCRRPRRDPLDHAPGRRRYLGGAMGDAGGRGRALEVGCVIVRRDRDVDAADERGDRLRRWRSSRRSRSRDEPARSRSRRRSSSLLAGAAWTLAQVGGIAVGVGPGLFTGLRVGVETAKTLAQVLHVPIVGFSGLDALAYAHAPHPQTHRGGDRRPSRRGLLRPATGRCPAGSSARPSPRFGRPITSPRSWRRWPGRCWRSATVRCCIAMSSRNWAAGSRSASSDVGPPAGRRLVELAVPRFVREEHDRPLRRRPPLPEEVRC